MQGLNDVAPVSSGLLGQVKLVTATTRIVRPIATAPKP
jgi:hypothetical protein